METSLTGTSNLNLDTKTVRKLLVDFIRDEAGNAGFAKGVVGLSGGVDSSLVAFLCAEALGKDNVLAVMMPYSTSSADSGTDAKSVIKHLGTRSETMNISAMVDGYLSGDGETSNVRKGNIMARARMIVLYDLSARE